MRLTRLCLLAAALSASGVPAQISIQPGGSPAAGVLEALDQAPMPAPNDRSGPEFFREAFTFQVSRQGMVDILLSANFDCYLFLFGPDGQEIDHNDDYQSTQTSRINRPLTTTGTHTLIVTSFSPNTGGTFTLTVGPIQEAPPQSRDQSISVGQTVQGELEPTDNAALTGERGTSDYYRDGYTFRGRNGRSITIDLACNFDGYLYLVGPDGEVLVGNDDFGSVNASRIVATLGSGGTHRIVVTSFGAGTTGQYSLTLNESEDVDPNQMSALQAQATMQMQNQYGGWQPQPTVYTPPDAPPSTGGPHRERSGVLEIVSEPLNVTAAVGETFLTSLRVHNAAGRGFDEVILVVRYDPQMLRPLRVSDHKLRPLVTGEPRLTSSLREGWIRYEAMLAETLKSDGLDLLTIEWRALAPTGRTRVDVLANPQTGSSLRLDGRDVLGTDDETDGTVGCDVAVRPATTDHLLAGTQTTGGAEPGELSLRLEAPAAAVRVGETIDVDIVLLNPKPEAFDDLQLALRFDPRVFEVVDAARGGYPPTGDNWISRGVNLLDGPFHAAFPFDCHLRNEVDNARGLADYRMGLTHPRALAGGTVARMTLRALAAAASTVIRFEQSPGAAVTTAVCLEGEDVLGRPDVPDDGTEGLQLRVEP